MTAAAAAAPQTTPPAAEKRDGTTYVIISSDNGVDWKIVNKTEAVNANAAIKTAVGKLGAANKAGMYVAVPSKSWNPVKLKVETKTTLKLETA